MQQHIFEGVKIVGFVYAGVGTLTMKTFAEHGATSVRIESMTRPDNVRLAPPWKDDVVNVNGSFLFDIVNNDRLSVGLNMNHPRALEVAQMLVRWADVVVDNFRPGTMAKWGLSYEDIKKLKPDIIMISTSLFGNTGPHADMPGYGPHLQAYAGFTNMAGRPDGRSVMVGQSVPDFIAPTFGVTAVIAALDYRRRTGQGQYIDLSELETAIFGLAPALLDYTVNGRIQTRAGNSCHYAAPHNTYRCQGDDRWCAIAVFTEQEWRSLCEVMGNPEWSKEARFQTLLGRKENEADLDRLIEEWTVNYPPEDVMAKMQEAGVAAGVVQNAEDVCEHDPQVKHRHQFWELDQPVLGRHSYLGGCFTLSKTPRELKRGSPLLGEHSEYVYKELLGMSQEEYDSYLLDGVFE